jgi:hypothetical protein
MAEPNLLGLIEMERNAREGHFSLVMRGHSGQHLSRIINDNSISEINISKKHGATLGDR